MIDTHQTRLDTTARQFLLTVMRGQAHILMKSSNAGSYPETLSRWKIIALKVKWVTAPSGQRSLLDLTNTAVICYCETENSDNEDTKVSAVSLEGTLRLLESSPGGVRTELYECSCELHGNKVPDYDPLFDRIVSKYEYVKHLASTVTGGSM